MLKTFRLEDGKLAPAELNGPIQVYINPDEEEKKFLLNELKIDEHTLNSSLDPDEVSRIEFEPNHAALIFKAPRSYSGNDNLLFKAASLGAFLFKDRLVVVMVEELPLFEGKQFTRVQTLPGVLLKLINRSTYHFREHLKIINLLTDELEHKINASMENRYLINLFTLEKSLVYYLNAINSNAMMIEKVKHSAAKIDFLVAEGELLDDIMVDNTQCYRQAEIYSNILASLMDARVSIVSNNLNILIKTLNILTIAIMVPTFVVSAFSMNVRIPMEEQPWAFYAIMAMAALSVSAFMIAWRYKKW
jgi:magnesium transporter